MNIDLFSRNLSKNSISSGNFLIYYNFSNISGDIVTFNELYPYSNQYQNNRLIIQNNPGIVVGPRPSGFNDYSGSGFFGGDTVFRMGKNLNLNDWSLFLNIKNSGCSINRNLPTVILSNKRDITGTSGFCFGLNGANKFFIENTVSGETRIKTTEMQGYKNNCISLSKVNNRFEISLHDPLNNLHRTEEFVLNDYRLSDQWFFGNAYNSNDNYTGFVGYFDDLILISGFIGKESRQNLSKAIFYTGYVPPYLVPVYKYYPKYSSTEYTTSGIIGVGITGYQEYLIDTIETKNGNIGVYQLSELTGILYGEKVQYFTSPIDSGIVTVYQQVPESFLIDNELAKNYSSNYIKFGNIIDQNDALEVYNFGDSNFKNKILKNYDFESNSIFLDSSYSGQILNLHLNGVLQFPVSGSANLNQYGDYYLSEPQNLYSNNFYELITNDKIIYYENQYSPSLITYTGEAFPMAIAGIVTGKNLYLNGQKLISGINYTGVGNYTYINKSTTFAEGTIYAVDDLDNYISYYTGYGNESFFDKNYTNEKVFLNGILQEFDIDYKKYSCISLLTGDFIKIKENSYYIYSNDTGFFDV